MTQLFSLVLFAVALVAVAVYWIVRRRRPRLTEDEFLRLVMRAVRYDGGELNLQPPARHKRDQTLKELLRTVRPWPCRMRPDDAESSSLQSHDPS
jgi:hypothetical protein